MNVKKSYEQWLDNVDNIEIMDELKNIQNNKVEIQERFYKNIEFGTAGMRGIMGAGTNRINIYTVRQATQGLSNYLNEKYKKSSVTISFDSRRNSKIFACEAAKVLAGNDIKVYISSELQPTPFLSFAVRHFKCQAGIMITASHNSAEYNGYKCYGEDGGQLMYEFANSIYNHTLKVDMFNGVKVVNFEQALEKKLISFIENEAYEKYLNLVFEQRINKNINISNLGVTYTPLNGAGSKMVQTVLKKIGLTKLNVVKEQENPDEKFSTCTYPNPEIKSAFSLAFKLADEKQSDIIIATDPDADRLGVCVKNGASYRLLNGNEIGILFLNYILSYKKNLPKCPVVVKTIVSSKMADLLAKSHGCELMEVLTGFKNIAGQILRLEKKGEDERFIFGFEESNGYLTGTYTRDKDGIVAAMLMCEMAGYYKSKNLTLIDVLKLINEKYGFYTEKTLNFYFEGQKGLSKMKNFMKKLREKPLKKLKSISVLKIEDYLNFQGRLKANMLKICLVGGHEIIIRPSGTEPKIKVYIMVKGNDRKSANVMLESIVNNISSIIKCFVGLELF